MTLVGDETPHGVTANAFTSDSLVAPLVLVCLGATTRRPATPFRDQLHQKGGDTMKKFSVRRLETLKTTAALYHVAHCDIAAF